MEVVEIDRRLRSLFEGRKWIVIADAAAAATPTVNRLGEWGAEAVMVIAAVEGVGDLPDHATMHYTRTSGSTIMEGVRAFARSLEDPSGDLLAAVASFDPDREASILAPPFGLDRSLADRRPYGARRPQWIALEDKTVVDDLWHKAGLTTAPYEIVEPADAPAAHEQLKGPLGTVWVADNATGWHGGGEYVRWARDDDRVDSLVGWYRTRARLVRVMPFLDGLPCSIHGFVTDRGVAAFRPVEMLIARVVEPPGFHYLGFSTTWDPPAGVRAEMRAAARSVGATLAAEFGYRGAFSIDGVATAFGFRPTELNPRLSAGLGIQASTVPQLAFGLMTRAMIEGDIDLDPEVLEATIVGSADSTRVAHMGLPVMASIPPDACYLSVEDGDLRVVEAEADGTLEVGPSTAGSYVRMTLDPGVVPAGSSLAPLAVRAAVLASRRWGFDLPDLQPAPDLSR